MTQDDKQDHRLLELTSCAKDSLRLQAEIDIVRESLLAVVIIRQIAGIQ